MRVERSRRSERPWREARKAFGRAMGRVPRATAAVGVTAAVRVGDCVQVAPTSPIAGHVGCRHEVTELFTLGGVRFAVLAPQETTIPPIVAVDELIRQRPRGASR